jgi:hypothetical protein
MDSEGLILPTTLTGPMNDQLKTYIYEKHTTSPLTHTRTTGRTHVQTIKLRLRGNMIPRNTDWILKSL